MKYPTTRFVFDRKNTATRKKAALVQVEILLQGRKKYVSTGVKVYKDQWNDKSHVINCNDMLDLNDRIDAVKSFADNYIQALMRQRKPFDWDAFGRYMEGASTSGETFVAYIRRRIDERQDIKASTKKSHRKILASLEDFGRLTSFTELTKANIADYYDYLLGHEYTRIGSDGMEENVRMSQQTAWGYMKILRTYIHDAMLHDKLENDPSKGVKVKRGYSEQTRWLTEEEIAKLESAKLSSGSLVRVRDLFIFGCYSGLAFSDLMDFKPEKLEKEGNETYLYGKRIKTGEEYIVLILPKAQEILEKYGYKLPKYSNQQYNKRLKDVAKEAGVDKPISSHYSRITFGFLALNRGVRIEVVSKAMGHATISETQRTYSRILKKTVVSEMAKLKE